MITGTPEEVKSGLQEKLEFILEKVKVGNLHVYTEDIKYDYDMRSDHTKPFTFKPAIYKVSFAFSDELSQIVKVDIITELKVPKDKVHKDV